MSVRASWHTATVEIDDSDPFADDTPLEEAVHVPTVGLPIDVNASKASLDARLADTLRAEARLAGRGATCEIKWSSASTCFACPLYAGAEGEDAMARLCRLGREQDSLLTLLAIRKHGDGR